MSGEKRAVSVAVPPGFSRTRTALSAPGIPLNRACVGSFLPAESSRVRAGEAGDAADRVRAVLDAQPVDDVAGPGAVRDHLERPGEHRAGTEAGRTGRALESGARAANAAAARPTGTAIRRASSRVENIRLGRVAAVGETSAVLDPEHLREELIAACDDAGIAPASIVALRRRRAAPRGHDAARVSPSGGPRVARDGGRLPCGRRRPGRPAPVHRASARHLGRASRHPGLRARADAAPRARARAAVGAVGHTVLRGRRPAARGRARRRRPHLRDASERGRGERGLGCLRRADARRARPRGGAGVRGVRGARRPGADTARCRRRDARRAGGPRRLGARRARSQQPTSPRSNAIAPRGIPRPPSASWTGGPAPRSSSWRLWPRASG